MYERLAGKMIGISGLLMVMILSSSNSWSLDLPAESFFNLRSEEFRKRESAQADLLTWARGQREPAMDELFRQSRIADDPEVRERCIGILRELVMDDYLKDGQGYIGIQMMDMIANVPGDPRPRGVVRVAQVMADSAAAQAGLQVDDLIAGLGDQIWHDGVVSLDFGKKIKEMKPNTKIMLKVLRKGVMMDVEVTLRRRPAIPEFVFPDEGQVDIEKLERQSRDEYFRKWMEQRKARK